MYDKKGSKKVPNTFIYGNNMPDRRKKRMLIERSSTAEKIIRKPNSILWLQPSMICICTMYACTPSRHQRQSRFPMRLTFVNNIVKRFLAGKMYGLIKRKNHPRSNIQFYQVKLVERWMNVCDETKLMQPNSNANISLSVP